MTLIIGRKESDGIRLYADRITMMGPFKLSSDTKKIITINDDLTIGIAGDCAATDRAEIYLKSNCGRMKDSLTLAELIFEMADHLKLKMKEEYSITLIVVYKGVIYHTDELGSLIACDEICGGLGGYYASPILKYNNLTNQQVDMGMLFKAVNECVPTVGAEFDTVFLPL